MKCGLKYDENQIRLFLCFNCTEEEMESHNTCPHLHLLLDIQKDQRLAAVSQWSAQKTSGFQF